MINLHALQVRLFNIDSRSPAGRIRPSDMWRYIVHNLSEEELKFLDNQPDLVIQVLLNHDDEDGLFSEDVYAVLNRVYALIEEWEQANIR